MIKKLTLLFYAVMLMVYMTACAAPKPQAEEASDTEEEATEVEEGEEAEETDEADEGEEAVEETAPAGTPAAAPAVEKPAQ